MNRFLVNGWRLYNTRKCAHDTLNCCTPSNPRIQPTIPCLNQSKGRKFTSLHWTGLFWYDIIITVSSWSCEYTETLHSVNTWIELYKHCWTCSIWVLQIHIAAHKISDCPLPSVVLGPGQWVCTLQCHQLLKNIIHCSEHKKSMSKCTQNFPAFHCTNLATQLVK
mgnify:CR=1 FL=1